MDIFGKFCKKYSLQRVMDIPGVSERHAAPWLLVYDPYEEQFMFPLLGEERTGLQDCLAAVPVVGFVDALPPVVDLVDSGPVRSVAEWILSDAVVIHDEKLAEEARRVARAFLVMEEL